MAGKTVSAVEKINQQLTCPIHLETFVDPKLLNCHHVFCSKCLYALADNGAKNSVLCPTCRRLTRLPPEGVDALPKAFHVLWLYDLRDTLIKERAEESDQSRPSSRGSTETDSNVQLVSGAPPIPPRNLVRTPCLDTESSQRVSTTTPSPPLEPCKNKHNPHQDLENWYIDCTRMDAKLLLMKKKNGTFLIRPAGKVVTESDGLVHTHTIDIMNSNKIGHIKILLQNGKYGLAKGACTFVSLADMVEHYSQTSLQCHNDSIVTPLSIPVFAS